MPKRAVKSTRAVVGGPPAATRLVRDGFPSTLHTTINRSPSASATLADSVAIAPVGGAHCRVIGAGQLTVGTVLWTLTEVEQVATQSLVSVTDALTWCEPTEKVVVRST